jgi:hypothetical protein
MNEQKKTFKVRLDYYYKLLVIYFIFLAAYIMMRGSIGAKELRIVFHDPILYITGFFILYTLIVLLANMVRSKEIQFCEDRFVIRNRFGKRDILFKDIMFVKFSRERRKYKDGKSSVKRVRIKLINRRHLLRIRLSEFYDENILFNEFNKLSKTLK